MTKSLAVAALTLALFACGPSCPSRDARRDDFPLDDRAGGLTVHLAGNVLTQANARPARLLFDWTSDEPTAQAEVIGASGVVVLRHALAKSAGPHVDMQLVDEAGALLPGGAYRVVITSASARVSAAFELRVCTVYY